MICCFRHESEEDVTPPLLFRLSSSPTHHFVLAVLSSELLCNSTGPQLLYRLSKNQEHLLIRIFTTFFPQKDYLDIPVWPSGAPTPGLFLLISLLVPTFSFLGEKERNVHLILSTLYKILNILEKKIEGFSHNLIFYVTKQQI